MELLTAAIVIVMGIGALVIGLLFLAILPLCWWAAIPLICGWVGGGFGLLFGIGLDVIIAGIIGLFHKD